MHAYTIQKGTSESEVHPNFGRKTVPEMLYIFGFSIFCSSSRINSTIVNNIYNGGRTVIASINNII
jgi:hypothetical protein